MFRNLDFRLKLLLGIAVSSVIVIVIVILWWFWATNPGLQFGDSEQWPTHTTETNNMSFRYPPSMEVIVPANEKENPVSLVKKGERGESVLIQVGTWRLEKNPPTSIEETIARYEARFPTARPTIDKKEIMVDGREGVLYLQEEAGSGRIIGETFFWDVEEPREVSLQLPAKATAQDRALWESIYREIVFSLDFVVDQRPADIPDGLPFTWHFYQNEDSGFSLWYPPGWSESAYVPAEDAPVWLSLEGTGSIAFESQDGTGTKYIIQPLPREELMSINELEQMFAEPFRESALPESVSSETAGFPGRWGALSLEGRTPAPGFKDPILVYLLLLADVSLNEGGIIQDRNEQGTAFVAVALLPEGKQRGLRSEQAREITGTFRILEY